MTILHAKDVYFCCQLIQWCNEKVTQRHSDKKMVLGKIKFFLVGLISAIFVRLLFCTLSVREIPDALSHKYKRQGQCMIYAFWHAHLLVPTCVGRNLGAKVLVSQHRDGE